MSTTYSHAAPLIRRLICEHINSAEDAKLKRDRERNLHVAFGLAQALEVLMRSDDTVVAPGIAEADSLPMQAITRARAWLGHKADRYLPITEKG